jgi:hypothetical protein
VAKNLSDIKRAAPAEVLKDLKSEDQSTSRSAAERLVRDAKDSGLSMQDYLKLAVDCTKADDVARYSQGGGKVLNGFEATLMYLGLPFRDNFEHGVFLQAASDTFQKYPGTRAMFPEVIDQMLRWKSRQDQLESIAPLIAQTRTISGTELISTVVDDESAQRGTSTIAEFGKIPVRTIRTSQSSVGIFKHGSGIRTSYEFERRASLDILTPFASRVARELELSKVRAAVSLMINGDGVNAAAPVESITVFGGVSKSTTAISAQYKAVATWLAKKAAAGTPIDTVIGNVNMYLELLFMFTPLLNGQRSQIEAMAAAGAPGLNMNIPLLGGSATFALASSMPDYKLLGISKNETLEELVEAGSSISENERSIQNQAITYVRSENSGFKLAYADTRFIFDAT